MTGLITAFVTIKEYIVWFGLRAWEEIILPVWLRTLEILKQPLLPGSEMLWILLPLLATLFLIELYFSRYKKEELGWNSALGNALVLFFVGMNLFGRLQAEGVLSIYPVIVSKIALAKVLIATFVIFESIVLITTNFFHLIPKKFAFGISSVLVLNFIGVMSIILIYSNIPIDQITLLAVLFIFVLLLGFFKLVRTVLPGKEVEEEIEETEEAEVSEEAKAAEVSSALTLVGSKITPETHKQIQQAQQV